MRAIRRCPTGQVLTLGGSWDDRAGHKDGELFTPSGGTGSWSRLPGVGSDRILTADPAGVYRADNHAWLLGWTGARVFHAGPSRTTHWITTTGNGTIVSAGPRSDSPDAMNGNAVMYDVGKILTVGGATAYQDVPRRRSTPRQPAGPTSWTSRAGPGGPVDHARASDMAYARAFCNSVVLPDGTVLVVGGQQHPQGFTDTGAVLSPELWDPATGQFTVWPRRHPADLPQRGGAPAGRPGVLRRRRPLRHLHRQSPRRPRLHPALPASGRRDATHAPGHHRRAGIRGGRVEHHRHHRRRHRLVRPGPDVGRDAWRQQRPAAHPTHTHRDGRTGSTLPLPADRGILLPGMYLLFALDADGAPSIATFIRIT